MKRRFPRAARYAADAAYMLSETVFPLKVVEKHVRRTLAFWCYFDSIDFPEKLPRSEVRRFAKLFRKHLDLNRTGEELNGEFDITCYHVNRAALEAVREWASTHEIAPQVPAADRLQLFR
jgi:hypothetical protein